MARDAKAGAADPGAATLSGNEITAKNSRSSAGRKPATRLVEKGDLDMPFIASDLSLDFAEWAPWAG